MRCYCSYASPPDINTSIIHFIAESALCAQLHPELGPTIARPIYSPAASIIYVLKNHSRRQVPVIGNTGNSLWVFGVCVRHWDRTNGNCSHAAYYVSPRGEARLNAFRLSVCRAQGCHYIFFGSVNYDAKRRRKMPEKFWNRIRLPEMAGSDERNSASSVPRNSPLAKTWSEVIAY